MSFEKTPGLREPFDSNEFLRSTVGLKHESYTLAHTSVPTETIDGSEQKILQGGEIVARITSGPEAGKIGPFQAGATDGRQTAANIVGINDSFVPWSLLYRDQNVGVLKSATAVQAWCFERDAAGKRIPLSNTTRDAILALSTLTLTFE